jgi:radical SAM superfamily enzyme YgiQ (UPF0313 family)
MSTWEARTRASEILSREIGSVRKVHARRLKVALAFPNSYYVGMSNLGFQTVYRLFNDLDEVVCERVFLPASPGSARVRVLSTPLRTLESDTPVGDFDIFAFSVSFEQDYTNIVSLLRLAGLPVHAEDRHDGHSLVVIGGAVTFLNPEPIAPFADVIAVGEGEVLVPDLVRVVADGGVRSDMLGRLARMQGFYVPALVDVRYAADGTLAGFVAASGTETRFPVRKAALAAHAAVDPPSTVVFTPDTEFGSRLLIETVRGCANLCRFCWAGYNYLPVRPFEAARILRLAEQARAHTARIGLVSIALCDHPDIDRILSGLLQMGYRVSPASLRIDELNERIVRALRAGGERTITIAPEAGSDRLRRVMNKPFTNDEIIERADLVFACGLDNLKLYYMVGLPTETDSDVAAIRDLTLRIRDRLVARARPRGGIGRISVSVNPLVPKPFTPFQWLPLDQATVTERKLRWLRAELSGVGNVRLSVKSGRHTRIQALLSLGDRRVARAIEAAERNGGDWFRAVAEVGLDFDFYVSRDRRGDPLLPWDTIAGGPGPVFLRNELAKCLHAEPTRSPLDSTAGGG